MRIRLIGSLISEFDLKTISKIEMPMQYHFQACLHFQKGLLDKLFKFVLEYLQKKFFQPNKEELLLLVDTFHLLNTLLSWSYICEASIFQLPNSKNLISYPPSFVEILHSQNFQFTSFLFRSFLSLRNQPNLSKQIRLSILSISSSLPGKSNFFIFFKLISKKKKKKKKNNKLPS